jgi:hypothetical protein
MDPLLVSAILLFLNISYSKPIIMGKMDDVDIIIFSFQLLDKVGVHVSVICPLS